MLDQDTEQDKEIVCESCGVTFVLSASETARRARRGITEPPKHCSLCRSAHAQALREQSVPSYTGDPNEYRSPMACDMPAPQLARGPHRGRSPDDARPLAREGSAPQAVSADRRRRSPRQLFTAVCSNCGSTAHVPFQPSRFQQVLCRSCYHARRGGGGNSSESAGD